ncbi:MAG: methionine synthase [bacterium]|nr:MAG: methionine synthase [bacterium]
MQLSNSSDKELFKPVSLKLELNQLNLSTTILVQAMGYGEKEIPPSYRESIDTHLKEAQAKVDILAGFIIIPPQHFHLKKYGFRIDDIDFRTGKIIGGQLINSQTVAIFAATAGPAFEDWSRQLFDVGDYPAGYVVDFIGSEVAEAAADQLEIDLQDKISSHPLKMTNRFSPGYCGWNVKEQFKLFSLLPENFCGISLTESALMTPLKSVSGIIGIGNKVLKTDYPCDICTMKNCHRRVKTTS